MSPRWIHSRNRGLSALLVAALSLPLAGPALAAGKAGKPSKAVEKQVRQLYGAAQKAYDLGRFEEALKGFSDAYALKDLPGFLFNIAQCHRNLGNYERAKFFYNRYLDLSPKRPKNAAQVEALLAKVEEKLAEEEARLRREAEDRAAAQRAREMEEQRRAEEERKAKAAAALVPAAVPVVPSAPPVPAAVPAPAVTPSPPAASVAAVQQDSGSVLNQWWFWAGVGVVAAGAGAATYVATTPQPRTTTLGDLGSP
jgi:tetratricopeptide (TPR) repeat protein